MAESWTAPIRCPSSTFRGQYNVAVTDFHVLEHPYRELGWSESCIARGDAGFESCEHADCNLVEHRLPPELTPRVVDLKSAVRGGQGVDLYSP